MLRVWFLPIVDACSTLGWFWVYPTFISVFWYWLPVVHCYTILIVFVYCFVVQLLFLVGNMCLLHFAKHGCCSKSHVSLNRLCSITPRPVTRGVQGGKCPLRKISAPPWKNVLDKVSEIWAPLRKLFATPCVPSWWRTWLHLGSVWSRIWNIGLRWVVASRYELCYFRGIAQLSMATKCALLLATEIDKVCYETNSETFFFIFRVSIWSTSSAVHSLNSSLLKLVHLATIPWLTTCRSGEKQILQNQWDSFAKQWTRKNTILRNTNMQLSAQPLAGSVPFICPCVTGTRRKHPHAVKQTYESCIFGISFSQIDAFQRFFLSAPNISSNPCAFPPSVQSASKHTLTTTIVYKVETACSFPNVRNMEINWFWPHIS